MILFYERKKSVIAAIQAVITDFFQCAFMSD